ncbi:PREDICTED: serine/threonine-phosphatase 7 [Prunus dulcis]|uniref:PREDICTED: serine/threonine-phosphatase 7 n=1 Tax=Prunus dulcis TaxID=3755 RepID=A0A5E4F3Q7_PRUDU|nr:PREDICTED: serine/threonine-phosphatase 7 [Prunus dulcis]
MEVPQDYMVEEREEYMVSPTGGNPFLRKAYFLKPTLPSSAKEPPLKLPLCFSSLPSHFEPKKKWPLKVKFPGWRTLSEDFITWVDRLASVHESTWKKAGIYEAILSSRYEIRRQGDLACGFAEKWCSETNSFIFPWGEATITLEDVMVLGGFSVLGHSVLSPLETTESKEIEEKLNRERRTPYRDVSRDVLASEWLKKFRNSGTEFEHEAFLALWLSRFVFQGASCRIHKHAISMAIHLARGTRIALAPAVLASIYRDLGLLKREIVASNQLKRGRATSEAILRSPFQLVQVWAWERFSELRPKPNDINYTEPRMARWEGVDGLKEKWVLVGPDLDDELLSFVRCLRVSELVGLGTIEHYLPHRVAMQFGFDQELPCSVTRRRNSDVAWKHYNREIKNVKLYLPPRLFEGDVSTKYLKWWKQSVLGLEDANEAAVPQEKKDQSVNCSLLRANHTPAPPSFPPKWDRMEAPINEDKLTVSEVLKHNRTKKHRNLEIRQDGDSEKLLSDKVQLASPISEKKFNTDMVVSIVGNECHSRSSLFEKGLLEFEKRDSELAVRFKRLESVVQELKAHRSGTSFRKS